MAHRPRRRPTVPLLLLVGFPAAVSFRAAGHPSPALARFARPSRALFFSARSDSAADAAAEWAADPAAPATARAPAPLASVYTGRWIDTTRPAPSKPSPVTVAAAALTTLLAFARGAPEGDARALSHELNRWVSTLDRGDFRWEFLVPWRKEKLNPRDKAVICVSVIGSALIAQGLWDPEASLFDHLSYLVFFFAYAIANNATLRQLAILGSIFEIFAFIFDEKGPERAEIVPVSYELLFIVINAYYALRGYIAEMPVELEDLERRVYEACFQPFGLSARQFVKILEEAEWHVASDGETLCVQGEPVTDVFVPISGAFSIVTRERGVVAPIGLFSLVGEVSLLENLQSEGGAYHRCAIASMVAEAGATYVRWPQRCFYELMSSDADFGKAMQVLISRALSKKLMQLWETDRGAAPERSPPPAAQPERSGPPAAAAAATRAGSEPPSRSGGAPM